jgi:RNA polymerase sigma-70 factor (ECF subfamily)
MLDGVERPVSPVLVLDAAPAPAVDVATVQAAQAGDHAAFGRLHARYARMVHAILLARVPRDDAEDLVQEVFLTAFDRVAGLREPQTFGGWLATIARHRATDFLRRRRETDPLSDQIPGPRPYAAAEALEAAEVLRAIRALPEAYRETLIMRLCEGMSGPEIAAQCGLEPGSVRVNLHRGMRLLREKLGIPNE